jgi:hypothetical protein
MRRAEASNHHQLVWNLLWVVTTDAGRALQLSWLPMLALGEPKACAGHGNMHALWCLRTPAAPWWLPEVQELHHKKHNTSKLSEHLAQHGMLSTAWLTKSC